MNMKGTDMRNIAIVPVILMAVVSCGVREQDYRDGGGTGDGSGSGDGVFCSSDADCKAGNTCMFCGYTVAGENCGCKGNQCGKCMPKAGCLADKDCGAGGFCLLPAGCKTSPKQLGQCKPRPALCNAAYSPVCGCDGKDYGNECVAHMSGATVNVVGLCKYRGKQCKDINAYLDNVIDDAKKCGPSDKCTLLVSRSIYCSCSTYVVEDNLDTREFYDLSIQLMMLDCKTCPACKTPTSAKCGPSGKCEDQF